MGSDSVRSGGHEEEPRRVLAGEFIGIGEHLHHDFNVGLLSAGNIGGEELVGFIQ